MIDKYSSELPLTDQPFIKRVALKETIKNLEYLRQLVLDNLIANITVSILHRFILNVSLDVA